MQEVEHSDAGYCDRNVRRLKARRDVKLRVEFGPRVRDSVQKGAAAADAMRSGYLTDHRPPAAVADHEMIVLVALEFVFGERRIDLPHGRFSRLHSVIGWDWVRCR